LRVEHPIPPYVPENAKILILGSFPSVKSREQMFFYGHPKNRFWKVLAALCNEEEPQSVENKKKLLSSHGVALYDVIDSCEITGSADNTIRDVKPSDISKIISHSCVERIFLNGMTAKKYYDKLLLKTVGIEGVLLPSTSPANAAVSLDKLIEIWREKIIS
jgi:hypoxanthine-DNA glycosylase